MPAEKIVNLNGDSPYEFPQRKTQKDFSFWRGLYNKDKHYFLGRTPKNWGELLVFYSVFYIVLAIFFSICMHFWIGKLDDNLPKWTLEESRIGNNPGLGFRPLPRRYNQGSLIWFDANNSTEIDTYTRLVDKFLEGYVNSTITPSPNQVSCSANRPAAEGKFCKVEHNLGNCTRANGYGFKTGTPCVFLKLNKIIGWTPQSFSKDGNGNFSFPENMPVEVQQLISNPKSRPNDVYISCHGRYQSDNEKIGTLVITPSSIPAYYYPYKNVQGYLSPLVAVQFLNPAKGVILNVECIAWARNIIYHGGDRDRSGSVSFEIMVD